MTANEVDNKGRNESKK